MKRIEGNWIIPYTIIKNNDGGIIAPTSIFSTIQNGEVKNYEFGIENIENIDDYSKYFSLGNYVRLTRQDKSKTVFTFNIENLNKDSLVLKQYDGGRLLIYKKIPDSLKNKTNLIKLVNKSFELKTRDVIDTVYFDNSYLMIKYPNEPTDVWNSGGWNSGGWQMISVNGFDILLTGYSTSFIVKEINGKINLFSFGLGGEIQKSELKEIEINLDRVKTIVERIKELESD